jgi:hypothetical protein
MGQRDVRFTREPPFDDIPTYRTIGVAIAALPNGVQMVRQNAKSKTVPHEQSCCTRACLNESISRTRRLLDRSATATVKNRSALHVRAAISRHA